MHVIRSICLIFLCLGQRPKPVCFGQKVGQPGRVVDRQSFILTQTIGVSSSPDLHVFVLEETHADMETTCKLLTKRMQLGNATC